MSSWFWPPSITQNYCPRYGNELGRLAKARMEAKQAYDIGRRGKIATTVLQDAQVRALFLRYRFILNHFLSPFSKLLRRARPEHSATMISFIIKMSHLHLHFPQFKKPNLQLPLSQKAFKIQLAFLGRATNYSASSRDGAHARRSVSFNELGYWLIIMIYVGRYIQR